MMKADIAKFSANQTSKIFDRIDIPSKWANGCRSSRRWGRARAGLVCACRAHYASSHFATLTVSHPNADNQPTIETITAVK
jgi:hypothetical protein